MAIGDYKGDVRLYNCNSGYVLANFKDAKSKITGLQFIKNNVLVTSSLDGIARLYDLNKNILFREMQGEIANQINCLAVERKGELVFCGGFDPYQINVWSYKTGKIIETLELHTAPISHLLFSTENGVLVSASWD